MITGLFLWFIVFLGFLVIFFRLPQFIQATILKLDILIDLAISVYAFHALGRTQTALIGAALIGTSVGLLLYLTKCIRRWKITRSATIFR